MAHREDDGLWVISIRELASSPGAMHAVQRSVPTPTAIGTHVIGIGASEHVELDVRMESVVEGVLATVAIAGTATGQCVRCLDDVSMALDLLAHELFAYPERTADAGEDAPETDEDQSELDHDTMDVESMVRDAVVTALPFQPVCRRDCPGLCAQCGVRLADDPTHQHDDVDPRWAALADLAGDIHPEKRT